MISTVYTVALLVTVLMNGVAVAGAQPLRRLFAPLRERRLVIGALLVDIVLIPATVVAGAFLLGVDDMTRAALIILAASSTGPIGIALARAARGDVALAVSLVTALGILNVVTVPLITSLLLPESIRLPVGALLSTLVLLVVLPLVMGRLWDRVSKRPGASPTTHGRGLVVAARLSDGALIVALGAAVMLDPAALLDVWSGQLMYIAGVTMLLVSLAARLLSADAARRRTLMVVMNARAVALGLTLVALYLPDMPEIRTVVLGFGGIMQLVPIGVAVSVRLGRRRG